MVSLFDHPAEASATETATAQTTAGTPSQVLKPSATKDQSEEEKEILVEITEDDSEERAAAWSE